ncbi:hypothetical protein [Streptomyces sp. NPDC058755]|uniref:hypothetical protein n=1 Tax=Streptomyces sp. NPDC058755 TaxID=3346624 RepID=UPI0036BFE5E0
MINESALLESKTLRSSVLDRTDVLDRVKALSLLPDGMHVTTAMVAAYFEVSRKAIESLVLDHREELVANGYRVLAGTELTSFKEVSGIQSRSRSLALYPRRAVLNIAMLLRDSEVARQVCTSWTWSTWHVRSLWITPSTARSPPSTTASPTSSARPSCRCSTP